MFNWCKTISAVLLCGTLAFAQFDDEESSDSYDYGTSESSEEQTEQSVGTANAADDEWAGFNYEEMGISQWEFQQAKEEGISRDKLTQLVEMGVRPSEYMQHPWEKRMMQLRQIGMIVYTKSMQVRFLSILGLSMPGFISNPETWARFLTERSIMQTRSY